MFLAIIPLLKEINYSSSPFKKTREGRGGVNIHYLMSITIGGKYK